MNVCAITPDQLRSKGFREVKPNIFARLQRDGGRVKGAAVLFTPDGCFTITADARLADAKEAVVRLCNVIANGRVDPASDAAQDKKRKAEKLLSALMLQNLQPPEVAGRDNSDLEFVIGELVEIKGGGAVGDKAERRERRQARRDRLRRGLHRLAQKVAKNKVMVKLREAWAKVITGPVGKGAAKLVGSVLNIFGVPKKATETAIMAHHNRVASRLREGGWAGVAERATAHRGAWKGALAKEGKRFGEGYRQAAKDNFGGGAMMAKPAAAAVRGEVGAAVNEHELARAYMRSLYRGPADGLGFRAMYVLGSGCC